MDQLTRVNQVGALLALVGFLCSLTPSLLPRSWQMQGLVSGVTVASFYAVGVFISWLAKPARIPRPSERIRRLIWLAIGVLALIEVPLLLWYSAGWQNEIRRVVDMPPQGRYLYVGMFAISALVTAVLIGLARSIQHLYQQTAKPMLRFVPALAARLLALVLVTAALYGVADGILYRGFLAAANSAASLTNGGNDPGITQPTSPLRSGSPASLISWSSIGRRGRVFVASGPSPASIARLTGRPAIEPIRIYAGVRSARSLQGEADLVLAELQRTKAFGRQLLAIAIPEGTGGINRIHADPLEYMYGGDTAIVAMQYSYVPSGISFIADRPGAEKAGRILFDTIYRYWSGLPADHRPRLVVFAESLGTYGSAGAFANVADLLARTQGALYTGPPGFTRLWLECETNRAKGSLARLPVYQKQSGVVFADSAADFRSADGSLRPARLVFFQHASDAIVWWSPDLLWHKPDWLNEPAHGDVVPQMQWYPFITFWQVAADMIVGIETPPGHGHHYGPELPIAWDAILRPPNWTDSETNKLAAMFAR